jgi:hypothetical protein
MATAALRLTFPNGAPHPCPPFSELTGPQQRAMRTLANLAPGAQHRANFTLMMQAWNLPNRAETSLPDSPR